MATATDLKDVLTSFTTATDLAIKGLPQRDLLLSSENGISLLDVKNDLFLSYLQALALRNLTVIRNVKDGRTSTDALKLSNTITRKLVEHRVYLERGVRPLEQKLKYQVDRAVKAADDEERLATRKAALAALPNGKSGHEDDNEDASEDSDDEDEDSDDEEIAAPRANPAVMMQATSNAEAAKATSRSKSKEDGVYRPPRISATAMPTTESRAKKDRGPGRSRTVDEYINTEMSTAPLAQPSIGSNIIAGGRTTKDQRQLAKEQERRDYEETNLVRLPKESKKDLQRQKAQEKSGGFGGEEWQGLGDSLDRIGDLTRRKGKENALDRSRKRRAVEDGPRGSGIGEAFDVKKNRLLKKQRR